MGALENIGLFITLYIRTFTNLIKIKLWTPFLILAIFQVLGLIAALDFNVPPFKWVIHPILSRFLPDGVFHYPQFYLALPFVYSIIDNFILGPTIWMITLGATVNLLIGAYLGRARSIGSSYGLAFALYGKLFLYWLILVALQVAFVLIPTWYFTANLPESPRLELAIKLLFQFIGFGISAFLIYTIPAMVRKKTGLFQALWRSVKLCFRNPFFSYFIVLLPAGIKLIIDLLVTNFAVWIIYRYNPEVIANLLLIQIGLGVFLNLFTYSVATGAYEELT